MQKIIITLTLLSLLLAGCAHKIEIQQGNVVTQEQLAKLHTGMDKRAVKALLGSPLLQDPFHADRWDYYYSTHQGEQEFERYHLRLFFAGDTLERIEQEGTFAEQEYQAPREK